MGMNWRELDLDELTDPDDEQKFVPGPHPVAERAGEGVPVRVTDIGAGVWARFTGTLEDGSPVTMSGAVVGGPDAHGEVVAVAVRDYRGNPDVVIYIGAGQHVMLVDDPADYAARQAHALAPVYGPIVRAELLTWVGPDRRHGSWVELPPLHEPTPAQLAEATAPWEVHLSAVHRGHLPIS